MRTFPQWWVKLGDFGITKRIDSEHTALRTRVGTARYLAPEVEDDDLQDRAYTKAVDIWSLGCVLYHALAQEPPFPTMSSKKKPFPKSPIESRVSRCGVEFIRLLLAKDPIDRPTAMLAREHAWFIESSESVVRHSFVEVMPVTFPDTPQTSLSTTSVRATGNAQRETLQQPVNPPGSSLKAQEAKTLRPMKTTNHVTSKLIIPQPVPITEQPAASEEASSPEFYTPIEGIHWEDQEAALAVSRKEVGEEASKPEKHQYSSFQDTTQDIAGVPRRPSFQIEKKELLRLALVIRSTTTSIANSLKLKEGQYIVVTEMNSHEWWKGRTKLQSTGGFPSDHVQLIEGDVSENKVEELLALPSATLAPLALVQATRTINLVSFMGLEKGELIQVLGIVQNNENIWQGATGDRIGMFHVDWVERIGGEVKGPAPLKQVIASYDYTPGTPNNIGQLEYRAGDLIEVQGILNGPWWQGAIWRSGATGYFHSEIAKQRENHGNQSLDDLEARQKSHTRHNGLCSGFKQRLRDYHGFDEPKAAASMSTATQIQDLSVSSDAASPPIHEQPESLALTAKVSQDRPEDPGRAMIVLSPYDYPEASTPSLWFPTQTRVGSVYGFIIGRYIEKRSETNPDSIRFMSKVISREHCLITYDKGERQWYIRDLKSSGGTWVNSKLLSAPKVRSRCFPLNNGDVVQLGCHYDGGEKEIFKRVTMKVRCYWEPTS